MKLTDDTVKRHAVMAKHPYDPIMDVPGNDWMRSQYDDACCRRYSLVYFIGHENWAVKIGRSETPLGRMSELQAGNPVPLKLLGEMCGHYRTEQAMHKKFGRHKIRGEWYRLVPDIKSFIEIYCAKPVHHANDNNIPSTVKTA